MKYNPDWDAHEALQASVNAGEDQNDPANTFWQWYGHHALVELSEKYVGGDGFSIMQALRICANHDLSMPAWLASAYIEAFDKVLNFRAKSWDEVFGPATPKGKHLAAMRKERTFGRSVALEIHTRHTVHGESIDTALFESVGLKFNIGKTLASEYYYKYRGAFMAD